MLHHVPDVPTGLAFEHELFAAHGCQVGLWATRRRAIVCPKAFQRKPGFETAAARSAARGFPVHLRQTGGGAVPQGPGSLNLVLAFHAPDRFSIEDGYRLLTQVIKDALGANGDHLTTGGIAGSFCDGAWNLSIGQQKLVGTAQRWRPRPGGRPRVLAHALVLLNQDHAPGTDAVAAFHADLGLHRIRKNAHTSLHAAFGDNCCPAADFLNTAQGALRRLAVPIHCPDCT